MHVLFLVSGFGEHIVLKEFSPIASQMKFELSVASIQHDSTGLKFAQANNISSFVFEYSNNSSIFAKNLDVLVNQVNPDVIFLLFDKILPESFVEKYSKPILNIHPSLLPSFKGMLSVDKALNYGVKITGVTVHYVNRELDGGAIVMQSVIPIADNVNNYFDLIDVFRKHFVLMSTQVLVWLRDGRIKLNGRKVTVTNSKYENSEFYPNVEPYVFKNLNFK